MFELHLTLTNAFDKIKGLCSWNLEISNWGMALFCNRRKRK